ncbi:anthranilate synthase component II [Chryseobacterium sp. A301]
MRILVIDNYDSFTYNLVQILEQLTLEKVEVFRNDQIPLQDVEKYDKIILSPGPGLPKDAGNLLEVIKTYSSTKSILGVCLGQQAIAEAFGGSLYNLKEIFHGVSTEAIQVKEHDLLKGLPKSIQVGRYHSWAVNPKDLPEELEITSVDKNGIPMSLKHKTYDLHAVQYHPESILTPEGRKILENFITK